MKIGKVIETYGGQLFISTEDGKFIKLITKKEISEKFGLNIKIV